jgi:microcystin-dependent protein
MLVGKLGVTPTALTTISTNALNGNLANTLGAKMGKDTHVLTVDELATHSHTTTVLRDRAGDGGNAVFGDENYFGTNNLTSNTAGSSLPHNNLPPVAVVNYIIKF